MRMFIFLMVLAAGFLVAALCRMAGEGSREEDRNG